MNAAATKAVQTKSFRKCVENEGLVISAGTPEDFARYAKCEEARWRKVVKDAGITAE